MELPTTYNGLMSAVAEKVSAALSGLGIEGYEVRFETPPRVELGDLAFQCASLAKTLRRSPPEIAEAIAGVFKGDEMFAWIQPTGPYLNFKFVSEVAFGVAVSDVLARGAEYGVSGLGNNERVMVEWLSPNTNKPLHLGHVRNGVLGDSVINILRAAGFNVISAILVNDRGAHICKSMLAYERWGGGATPESSGRKPDHFVGDWYVRFAQEEERRWQERLATRPDLARAAPLTKAEEKIFDREKADFLKTTEIHRAIEEMLRKWEGGDAKVRSLWEQMNGWFEQGFVETIDRFGWKFTAWYYESKTYTLGKDIVLRGLRQGVFVKSPDGAIVLEFPREFGKDEDGNSRKWALLRRDGTSLYSTQDLGTTVLKFEQHRLQRAIWVVGNEQDDHFRSLFYALGKLGYPWAGKCHHLSYGMVNLPSGKMKSREGTVVDADDLLDEVIALAKARLTERGSALSHEEFAARAEKIALGAIKFYLLVATPQNSMMYDPAKSLEFEGQTGPYCMYTFVRCRSIMRQEKAAQYADSPADFGLLGTEDEIALLRTLIEYPSVLERAAAQYDPSLVARHVYDVCQAFNRFYASAPVLSAETPELVAARLRTVQAASIVIKNGLNLLGIETLEEM
ncbi:MAG: arginine--tRNA ligase [bacterium]|nr:arginine--tRNA ligase [bacterium]